MKRDLETKAKALQDGTRAQAERQDGLDRLAADLDRKESVLRQATAEGDATTVALTTREDAASQRESKLAALEAELGARQGEVEKARARISEEKSTTARTREELATREAELNRLQKGIKLTEEEIDEREAAPLAREEDLAQVAKEFETQKAQIVQRLDSARKADRTAERPESLGAGAPPAPQRGA